MRALLDVNVLIALLDGRHVHHARCMRWLRVHEAQGWSSCPLTQNGCVRILSQAGYPNPVSAEQAAARLYEATRSSAHEFWPDSLSILEPGLVAWPRLLSGRHLTDAYLLALAVAHRGRLATLDESVPRAAVAAATARHVAVIA